MELENAAGTRFDPRVVQAARAVVAEERVSRDRAGPRAAPALAAPPAPLRPRASLRPDDRVDLARGPLPGEPAGALEPERAQPRPLGLVAEQARSAPPGSPPARARSAARRRRGLGERGRVGGDDRRPARHRLEHRQAEALVERGQHERLGAGVEAGQLVVGDVAEQLGARPGRARPRTAGGGRRRPGARRRRSPSAAPPGRARARFLRAVCDATHSTYGRVRRAGAAAPKRGSTPPWHDLGLDAQQLLELVAGERARR